MNSIDELIEKHRSNGLLIDTNLFLLYLIGKTNRSRIPVFKRTRQYTIEDFDLLEVLVAQFAILITTPHLLTEVSNLATLHGTELSRFSDMFKQIVQFTEECYEESRHIMTDTAFDRLGLADAAIAALCRRSMLVLTDDLELHVSLLNRGVDSINFNHIRTYFWHG